MNEPSSPPPPEPKASPEVYQVDVPPGGAVHVDTSVSASSSRNWMAITSLVLGIINFCAMFIPFCGGLLPIVGLVLGILGLNSGRRGMAITGIVLSAITLCFAIVWSLTFGPILRSLGFQN
jgi:hypothetical protein